MEVSGRNVSRKITGTGRLSDMFDGIEMVHIIHRRKLTIKYKIEISRNSSIKKTIWKERGKYPNKKAERIENMYLGNTGILVKTTRAGVALKTLFLVI